MSLTPNDASVLCVITTNNSGGSHLIATINVTLQHTLADVRSVLVSLARGEGGGPKAVVEEPVNVSDVELKKQILSAPLHPFDLTECFYFVRAGGCRVVKEGLETRLTVGECIPRYPRFGVPREPAWCLSPPAPTVIVPRHPTARRTPKGKKLGHKYDNKHTGEKRTGVVWLQIAQGIVNRPYMVTAERVLAERLLLQQKFLYHRDGGSGYGQLFSVQSFGSSITKWNANVVDFLGRTLLHEVCQIGNEQAARFLLSKNYVVVEARDRSGNTPLHLAVQSCQGACVKLLLEHGADPLTPNDSTGDTPLHLALLRGKRGAAMVGLLCAHLRGSGVEAEVVLPSIQNHNGYSPLDLFDLHSPSLLELCGEGSLTAVKALIHHYLYRPAQLKRRTLFMRQTVLHVAAQSGNMEVLRYLLNDMQWVKRTWSQLLDARLQTPLHCAAAYGHVQCVGYLSECLPDQRNAQDINGNTPLLLALKKGQLRVAEFFLMNSSPGSLTANTQDSGGFTALHLVCSLGMAKAAGALLKHHGASVNLTTDLVDPLERRWSSKDRYRNVVLVSGRAPYNGRPTKRIAALAGKRATSLEVKTAESELSQPTSAELSYRAGAGRRGYTPILCAILAGSSYSVVELMGVLLKYGAVDNVDDARDLLFYLLTHKEYDMADHFFLSSPAMADEVSRDNKLLCRLCYARDAEGLRWCVDHKCGKLNSTIGGNPLTVATQVGDVGAVRYLLSISADPNVKLAFAENTVSSLQQPASVLLAALYHKQEAVIPILLQAGARLVSGDGKWSALRVAVEQRLESVVLGLLGTNRVNPVDVSQVLVDTLSDYNAPPRDAVAGRLLAHLVQYYDPSASVTHPTELLHMAAHWGQFEVVRRLIDRLVEQPTTLLFELLKETPGPSTRETEQIEPQSSPTDAKWVRLFSAGKSRRGAAGKGPQPFDRLVPPNYKRIRLLKTTLPHRIQCRDVYSYAMEAGEKEVVLRLQRGLRLRPWSTVSLCGFNLADYALQLNDVDMLKFIAALGMRPTRRHGKRLAAGAAAPLIRALNASQSTRYTADDKEGEPTAIMTGVSPSQLSLQVFTRVLVSFIQDRESSAPLLSALVEEHMAQYGVEDLSDAGLWFDPVYASCVTAGRLDYLKLFHDTYSCPLVKTSTEGKRQTAPLLLQAVFRNDVECVRYLLQAGCPAHARGVITTEYAAHIKVKNAESQEISPLCLAAWLGHFEMLQLLASSTPLTIEDCQDVPGEVNADALKALLRGPAVRGKVTAQQDLLLSNTVRTLASARHPFLSPLVMRLAASRGIPLTVQVLLDFYGEKAVETDLRPDEVNSLYYFASRPALCPLLRSLIVQRTVDEFGGERVVLTGFAMTVKEKMTNATVETDARSSIGVVDYALARGCTDGALILLALGLEGTGKAATHHRVSPLVTSIRTVLQHYQKVKDTYTTGQYTVLHSAVELGYKDVVQGLTAEMRLLPKVSTTVAKTEEAAEGGRRRPPVPSVYALAALHPEGWRWAARLEETAAVTNNQTRLRASDFFIFIFNHLPITRVLDMLCRLPENAKVFSHMFTLLDRDGFPSNFLTRQFQLHRPKLFFFGGRYLLTSCTPLACAVAAGSPEWVEYLSFCQPAMSHHKATVTRCLLTLKERTEYVRAATERRKSTTATAGNTDKKKKGGAFRGGQYRNAHPQKRHHACLAYSPSGPLPPLSNEDVSTVDILLLAVVAFCKAYYEGDINRMRLQKTILNFLLSLPGTIRKENINLTAIALAVTSQWELLSNLIQKASQGHLYREGGTNKGRFFHAVLNEEIPALLQPVIGIYRHVMQAAASRATKEVLVEIASHSVRQEMEESCDARGHTATYHVLRHRNFSAFETFAALRISMSASCNKKQGQTPLMMAAALGDLPIVSALLKPSRVNQQDRLGFTPLMYAAQNGHLPIVELLLASNADAGLRNQFDMTAVMVAAQRGHDHVAAPMALSFSKLNYFHSSQTSLLHCSAMGGSTRACEVALRSMVDACDILKEDQDGNTALSLAYGFGRAKVLRLLLAALYKGQSEGKIQASLDQLGGEVEVRLFNCDSTLPNYGWLQGVTEVNDTLNKELHQRYYREDNLDSRSAFQRAKAFGPVTVSLRKTGADKSLLWWCAAVGNAVGVRILADLNVADDCGALHVAASRGYMDVLKLLVTLRMSDVNVRSADKGLYAFEIAATAGHRGCASYLLSHTKPDPSFLMPQGDDKSALTHNILHRLAAVAGAELLVAFVERLLQAGGGAAVLCQKLLDELQQQDEVGLSPFEYTIATGDPAAVLRVAQLLQRLRAKSTAGEGKRQADAPISISNALFQFLPTLSPAVRTLLFDFFEVTTVMHTVGFEATEAEHPSKTTRPSESVTGTPNTNRKSGNFLIGAHDTYTFGYSDYSVRRLRFSDVRLLGIEALQSCDYCGPLVSPLFTQEHERHVLRDPMRSFPFRIRYNPDSFRQCTLSEQLHLLQWLGSSVVLSNYDNATPKDVESIEIEIITKQSGEFITTDSNRLSHSLYISSGGLVLLPAVADCLRSAHKRYRTFLRGTVDGLARRATSLLRTLPHPALRNGTVSVEWDIMSLPKGGPTVSEDRQLWDSCFFRVRNTIHKLMDLFRFQLHDLLKGTAEEDVTAIVSEVRRTRGAHIRCIFSNDSTLEVFPSLQTLSSELPECSILFNMDCVTDVSYMLMNTLYKNVAADVALVRVHYARDAFIHSVRHALRTPSHASKSVSPTAEAAPKEPTYTMPNIQFKLELEGASLQDVPLLLLEDMLRQAADAVGEIRFAPESIPKQRMLRFHSSLIVHDSVARRLRTVLVLYSTKREPLVKLSGEKLMLCFGPNCFPIKAEVIAELQKTLIEDEITACRRLLPEIHTAMSQRLSTYHPTAKLHLDLHAIDDTEHDRGHVVSSLRLLISQHSARVLQPLVDGVSIGWDGELGKYIRAAVENITLTLDYSGEHGTCYLDHAHRHLIYYCPLQVVERQLYMKHSWQLLTAQQVASCLLIQLAVYQPKVTQLVDTSKCFAGWSTVESGRTLFAEPHDELCLQIKTRNLLNYRVPAVGVQFKFVGRVENVRVKEGKEKGVYHVRLQAPPTAGYHRLYVLTQGQQLLQSPLRLFVSPDTVHLPNTRVASTFNTVLANEPFALTLRWYDKYKNRLLYNAGVTVRPAARSNVEILEQNEKGGGLLELLLRVKQQSEEKEGTEANGSTTVKDAGVVLELMSRGNEAAPFTLTVPLQVVTVRTYEQVCTLRKGFPLEAYDKHMALLQKRKALEAKRAAKRQKGQKKKKGKKPITPANISLRSAEHTNFNTYSRSVQSPFFDKSKFFYRTLVRKSERERLRKEVKQLGLSNMKQMKFAPKLKNEVLEKLMAAQPHAE